MDMLISHQQVNQLSRWDINISIFSNVKPRSRLARFDLYILNVICTGFEAPEVEIEALYLQYIPILSYSYIMSINVLYSHIYIYIKPLSSLQQCTREQYLHQASIFFADSQRGSNLKRSVVSRASWNSRGFSKQSYRYIQIIQIRRSCMKITLKISENNAIFSNFWCPRGMSVTATGP